MEFSDDFSSFQLKSLSHKVMDFSTDYASLILRRRRSTSVRSNSFTQHSTRSITSTMRRMTCMVGGVVVLLVAVALPSLLKNTTDMSDMNYITMWEEGDLSSLTMVAQKGNIGLEPQDISSNAEALNSINAALEMAKHHKNAKAKRLFLHALALAPHNARVLLHYGLFLEESDHDGHDLVEADHQYARAIQEE